VRIFKYRIDITADLLVKKIQRYLHEN